ncbi:hypothetical protein [Arsenicicoccus dermatophilus]|uniref:hypothetical protein n=1 Tax=Arsenicicoccus dermatophilus TaxID=1076331 RepID=UPI001F4C9B96|nr:hypothetical protein [Arsenicicoccus dermatophilus]MCH8611651.1 hypothetical protein [Arsenicicoccus dermatophilus]
MAAISVVLLIVDLVVIFCPKTDEAGRSDALVVLGPSVMERTSHAESLMRSGAARTLVISAHEADLNRLPDLCQKEVSRPYEVICFDPDPANTQGEARGVAALARRRGWSTLQVITFRPQVLRARVLISRCFPGRVMVLAHEEGYDPTSMFARHTAGLLKLLVTPSC